MQQAYYMEATAKTETEKRSLYTIAAEIKKDWKNISPYAAPYLSAMGSLTNVTDNYILDSGSSIVLYFLSNAKSWRGETAKRIKAELKLLCKGYY
jgi:hypothetical protein